MSSGPPFRSDSSPSWPQSPGYIGAVGDRSTVHLGAVQINVHAMDFRNILKMHKEAIRAAHDKGIDLLLFPELSLTGYGCEDHFLEAETEVFAMNSLRDLVRFTLGIPSMTVEVGMPFSYHGVRYNSRVMIANGSILGIRPKMVMANNGNYREVRYFVPWGSNADEPIIRSIVLEGSEVPIGIFGYTFANGVTVADEVCEEMWQLRAPHIQAYLSGVEIVLNGSGSEFQYGKSSDRNLYIQSATRKFGGTYAYANFIGCDGGRIVYDGQTSICSDGNFLASASTMGLGQIEIVAAQVSVEKTRAIRARNPTYGADAKRSELPWVKVPFALGRPPRDHPVRSPSSNPFGAEEAWSDFGGVFWAEKNQAKGLDELKSKEDYILAATSLWLWDYLRRSGASGFFLPLSGGADSASVAYLVWHMANRVISFTNTHKQLKKYLGSQFGELPSCPREFMTKILSTAYLGTENSSITTKCLAAAVASEIGSYHFDVDMQPIFTAVKGVLQNQVMPTEAQLSYGSSSVQDLALQNIQSRSRMLLSYAIAALVPREVKKDGAQTFYLVLGTGNCSEVLRGYLTKYDCSSADINPIASLLKSDVNVLLKDSVARYGLESFSSILSSRPSAELRPPDGETLQDDELDMGISYEELEIFARLRMEDRCGPLDAFARLRTSSEKSVPEIAETVKKFFNSYAANRHKTCTLTPGLHIYAFSPYDSRHDHRQILYPPWNEQFDAIDRRVKNWSRQMALPR